MKGDICQDSFKEFPHFPVVMGAFLDINKNLFLNALKTSIHISIPQYQILGGGNSVHSSFDRNRTLQ